MALPSYAAAILLLGSAWYPSRYPQVIERFSDASPNAAIATFARSFCRPPRVVLLRPKNWMQHGFGPWLAAAAQRLHHNVLATALANRLARIAWSVLAQHREYEARLSVAAT